MISSYNIKVYILILFLLHKIGSSSNKIQFISISTEEKKEIYKSFYEIYDIPITDTIDIFIPHRFDAIRGVSKGTMAAYVGGIDSLNMKPFIIVRSIAKDNKYVLHHEIFHHLLKDKMVYELINKIDYKNYVSSDQFKIDYSPFNIREYLYTYTGELIDTGEIKIWEDIKENYISDLYDSNVNEELFVRLLMNSFIYHPYYVNNLLKESETVRTTNRFFNLCISLNIMYNYRYDLFFNDHAKYILKVLKK